MSTAAGMVSISYLAQGQLLGAIAAVLDANRRPVGTAFLVSRQGLLITALHVLNSAGASDGAAEVEIRWESDKREDAARIVTTSTAEDVAVLSVHELPATAEPLPLGRATGSSGHGFQTFGYPAGLQGLWGAGHIGGLLQQEMRTLLQLGSSNEVTRGFSGSPVFDLLTQKVVGMIHVIARPDPYGRLHETAFAVPTESLRLACPQLELSSHCPYQGLLPFDENAQSYFCGREDVRDQLLVRLASRPRFLALLGRSGCGKTSLVAAGVVPAVKVHEFDTDCHWQPIAISCSGNFRQLLEKYGLSADDLSGSLAKFAEGNQHCLLILDQLEELLLPAKFESAAAFLAQVADVIASKLAVTVMIVLRSDFRERFIERNSRLADRLSRDTFDLPLTLSIKSLTEIIEQPAQREGFWFESGLVERIISDANKLFGRKGTDEVACAILPLLSECLELLWKRRSDAVLSHDAYKQIGGVAGSVNEFSRNVLSAARVQFGKDMEPRIRRLLIDLVQPGDGDLPVTRRSRALRELLLKDETTFSLEPLVRFLSSESHRLLSVESTSGDVQVSLVHDVLLQQWEELKSWVDEDQLFLLWKEEVERTHRRWVQAGRPVDRDLLLSERQLLSAAEWKARKGDHLSAVLSEYILISTRSQRRRRWLFRAGMAGIAVLILAFALFSLRQSQREEGQRQRAEKLAHVEQAARLTVSADVQIDSQPASAAAALLQAAGADLPQTELVARKWQHRRLRWVIPGELWNRALSFSPDGRYLAAGGFQQLLLWEFDGSRFAFRRKLVLDSLKQTVAMRLAYSPDGQFLAIGNGDGSVVIFDLAKGKESAWGAGCLRSSVLALAWYADGKRLLAGSHGAACLYTIGTAQPQRLYAPRSAEDGPVVGIHIGKIGVIQRTEAITLFQPQTGMSLDFDGPGGTAMAVLGMDDDFQILAGDIQGRVSSLGPSGFVGLYEDLEGMSLQKRLAELNRSVKTGQERRAPTLDDLFSLTDEEMRSRLYIFHKYVEHRTVQLLPAAVSEMATFKDRVAIGTTSGDISFIHYIRREHERSYRAFADPIRTHDKIEALAWHPSGKYLAVGTGGRDVFVYEPEYRDTTPALVHFLRKDEKNDFDPQRLHHIAFSPSGERVAVAYEDESIAVGMTLPRGTPIICSQKDRVRYGLAWAPDETLLAAGGQDGLRVYGLSHECKLLASHGFSGQPVHQLAFRPDGRELAVSFSDGNPDEARPPLMIGVDPRQPSRELWRIAAESAVLGAITWEPSGTRLLGYHSGQHAAVLFNPQTPEQRLRIPLPDRSAARDQRATDLAWRPGRAQAALTLADGRVYLLDFRTLSAALIHQGSLRVITASWSADGSRLALGMAERVVEVIDPDAQGQASRARGSFVTPLAMVLRIQWLPQQHSLLAVGLQWMINAQAVQIPWEDAEVVRGQLRRFVDDYQQNRLLVQRK